MDSDMTPESDKMNRPEMKKGIYPRDWEHLLNDLEARLTWKDYQVVLKTLLKHATTYSDAPRRTTDDVP